ncbi:MAG TPA: hypothetical protein VLV88_02455 [Terriglobales bacterium]|nr:hypothetical protein [Terriglobales bacterium]
MRSIIPAVLILTLTLAANGPARTAAQSGRQNSTAPAQSPGQSSIQVPAQTHVVLAMTSPVWAKSAQVGDPIYAQTAFPVAVSGTMAIPAGTYVQGRIEALKRPSLWSSKAEFQIQFVQLIFANGYAVGLGNAPAATSANPLEAIASADVLVSVSYASDILLDNGTQFEMVLQTPLTLDAKNIAGAMKASKPLPITKVQSATKCRPVPATPGTSPTIIPGTPGTPGTPDTVIPGAPGMPDTVIPGIPATPGTPDTVIGGSPGSPEISCPGPPVVISSLSGPWDHSGNFRLVSEVLVAGQKLAAGSYKAVWQGLGPQVRTSILLNEKEVARVPAQIVTLQKKPKSDSVTTNHNPNGTDSLEMLQFSGSDLALSFGPTGT